MCITRGCGGWESSGDGVRCGLRFGVVANVFVRCCQVWCCVLCAVFCVLSSLFLSSRLVSSQHVPSLCSSSPHFCDVRCCCECGAVCSRVYTQRGPGIHACRRYGHRTSSWVFMRIHSKPRCTVPWTTVTVDPVIALYSLNPGPHYWGSCREGLTQTRPALLPYAGAPRGWVPKSRRRSGSPRVGVLCRVRCVVLPLPLFSRQKKTRIIEGNEQKHQSQPINCWCHVVRSKISSCELHPRTVNMNPFQNCFSQQLQCLHWCFLTCIPFYVPVRVVRFAPSYS